MYEKVWFTINGLLSKMLFFYFCLFHFSKFQVTIVKDLHCVKCVQIRSYFWSEFSCIRTEYGDLRDFCLDFLVMLKKRFDYKDKVNFKIYDVTTWLINNYNTHIAHISQEIKATRQ